MILGNSKNSSSRKKKKTVTKEEEEEPILPPAPVTTTWVAAPTATNKSEIEQPEVVATSMNMTRCLRTLQELHDRYDQLNQAIKMLGDKDDNSGTQLKMISAALNELDWVMGERENPPRYIGMVRDATQYGVV